MKKVFLVLLVSLMVTGLFCVVGCGEPDPIVGKWVITTGQNIYMEFTSDGQFSETFTMNSGEVEVEPGKWSADGKDKYKLLKDNLPKEPYSFEVTGNTGTTVGLEYNFSYKKQP